MAKRVAFVTIGQSPRPDMVPEILAETRTPITVTERGALDGMSRAEVDAIAPRAGEERLVSRLADGTEVILGKPAIEARLGRCSRHWTKERFDLIVLLCTGHFGRFRVRTPFLEPQQAVDHFVLGLTYGVERLGILLPNRQQIEEFHGIADRSMGFAYASPYRAGNEADAARGRCGAGRCGRDRHALHGIFRGDAADRDGAGALSGAAAAADRGPRDRSAALMSAAPPSVADAAPGTAHLHPRTLAPATLVLVVVLSRDRRDHRHARSW